MSEYDVWWIDDNEDRQDVSKLLERHTDKISVKFNFPDRAIDELTEESETIQFDLVLVDWKLQEHGEFPGKGLTMAGRVQEEMPSVPIYGFSDAIQELRATAGDDQFDATFDVSQFKSAEGAKLVEKDLDSYAGIEDAVGSGSEGLLETLCAPNDAHEDLESIIPREYAGGIEPEQKGSVREFAYWARNRFLETPGPVLDDRWWATKIGLEEEGLEKHIDELKNSIDQSLFYNGIFSHRYERRWWATLAIKSAVSIAKERGKPIHELKTVAEEILDESDALSYCRVCQARTHENDSRPDILAAEKEGKDATHPVHLRCSHIHHTREGAFEDYRVADEL
jgi:hypothetical protein